MTLQLDIETFRRYAGASPRESPELLQGTLDAAAEWYERAGVPRSTEGSLYAFWVMDLAAWMYDNRGTDEPAAHIPDKFVTSVHQMRPAGSSSSTKEG